MKRLRHVLATLVTFGSIALSVNPGEAVADGDAPPAGAAASEEQDAPVVVATSATLPAAPPSTSASTAPAGDPAGPVATKPRRKLRDDLEVEVHGRVYMGVATDERDDWARELGMSAARIGIEARLPRALTVVEADLAATTPIKYAYVRLDGPAWTRLQAGLFKTPFTARRTESSWRLPLVERGLVDDYVLDRNELGGRRIGAAGELRPWDGRVDVVLGVFAGERAPGEERASEDYAAGVTLRPWRFVEVGASGYASRPELVPDRHAAAAHLALHVGPVDATLEGMTGRIAQGTFTAGTALVSATFGRKAGVTLTPVAGAEGIRLDGPQDGVGHAFVAGAVVGWADALKVKLQAERALRPGDDADATSLALQLATRF